MRTKNRGQKIENGKRHCYSKGFPILIEPVKFAAGSIASFFKIIVRFCGEVATITGKQQPYF